MSVWVGFPKYQKPVKIRSLVSSLESYLWASEGFLCPLSLPVWLICWALAASKQWTWPWQIGGCFLTWLLSAHRWGSQIPSHSCTVWEWEEWWDFQWVLSDWHLLQFVIKSGENWKQFLCYKNETKLATEWNKNLSYDKQSWQEKARLLWKLMQLKVRLQSDSRALLGWVTLCSFG